MSAAGTALNLLLIEDQDADAELFKALLVRYERLKYAGVLRCHTLADALRVLSDGIVVDCVILDLGLPDSSGLSGLWAIRAAAPSIPVLVLSGLDNDELAIAAVREGAQDYILKDGIDAVRLGRKIVHAVEREHRFALLAEQQSNATFLATHDALTGLANRRYLEETVHHTLAADVGPKISLVLIDLDGFKAINDTHGHATGDTVLRIVAKRLQNCRREKDLVARVGGDEFAMLLIPQVSAEAESAILARLRSAVGQPMTVDALQLCVTASIGVARHPDDGQSLRNLLRAADERMYADKALRPKRRLE